MLPLSSFRLPLKLWVYALKSVFTLVLERGWGSRGHKRVPSESFHQNTVGMIGCPHLLFLTSGYVPSVFVGKEWKITLLCVFIAESPVPRLYPSYSCLLHMRTLVFAGWSMNEQMNELHRDLEIDMETATVHPRLNSVLLCKPLKVTLNLLNIKLFTTVCGFVGTQLTFFSPWLTFSGCSEHALLLYFLKRNFPSKNKKPLV